jgi:zinc protease
MGYATFSNADLRKFLSGMNVSVSPAVLETSDQIDASSGIKDLETMLRLLYLKCTNPRKDNDAFKSFVTRSKQSSEQLKDDPRYLFMDSTNMVLYRGNKRAHVITPLAEYDKINPDHALAFYNQRFNSAAGMYYVIVGSFTEEQILPLIEKYIGGLSSKPVNTTYKDLGIVPLEGKQNFTLRKGSEDQGLLAHYFTGKMPYNADDNFKLGMLNSVIRNMITDEIREKMSAIYGGGVGGSLSKFPREEFMIRSSFPCGPDNINDIDKAFMALIENVKKDGGITDAQLQKVQEPALESNRVNLKVNRYWLNNLISACQYGNDPERIIKTEQMIKDLTPAQLVETAKKFYSTPNIFKAEWLPESVR